MPRPSDDSERQDRSAESLGQSGISTGTEDTEALRQYLEDCIEALNHGCDIPQPYPYQEARQRARLIPDNDDGTFVCWLAGDRETPCHRAEESLIDCTHCTVYQRTTAEPALRVLEGIRYLTTEVAQREQELVIMRELLDQSENLAALGQQVGAVTHELNNIIGSIMGYAQLAKLTGEEQDAEKFMEVAITATTRAKTIIQSLRSAKRREKNQGIQHVSEILDMVLDHLNRDMGKEKIVVHRDYQQVPWVITDPVNLQRVFLSICSHLANDMDDGGKIDISIRHRGEWIEVRLSGETRGPLGDARQLSFDAFYPHREEAAGNGSTQMPEELFEETREMVSRLGGQLDRRRRGQNRTVFSLKLPLG